MLKLNIYSFMVVIKNNNKISGDFVQDSRASDGHQKFVAPPNARLNQWASGKAGGFKELLWNLGFFFGLRFP